MKQKVRKIQMRILKMSQMKNLAMKNQARMKNQRKEKVKTAKLVKVLVSLKGNQEKKNLPKRQKLNL